MNWLSAPASAEASRLAEVGWVLIALAGALFLFTMALLVHALRRRPGPVSAARWTIGLGMAFPATLLSVLLVYQVGRTAGLERAPGADPLVVSVTGHLWWWEVRYRDPRSGRWIALANELHLPAGRSAQIGLASADVIHSFWVPTLGGKMDLVPGRVNRLVVTPVRTGVQRGVCAEFCGTQHARMALHVVVEEPAAFERWLAAQAADAATPRDALALRGRAAFLEHGCAGCHAVRGVAAGSGLGPDLTHVGSRLYLGAGTLRNEPAALGRWIADVQAVKSGARMPAFHRLDPSTLAGLTAYLGQLQ